MTNKEFIQKWPGQINVKLKYADEIRKMLKEANTHYVVDVKEKPYADRIDFYITVPTTTFAHAYMYIGGQYRDLIRTGKVKVE